MAQTARLLPAATQVIDAAPVTGVHGVHASDVPAAELSVLKYPALHAATRLLPMVLQATESAFATGVHGSSQQSVVEQTSAAQLLSGSGDLSAIPAAVQTDAGKAPVTPSLLQFEAQFDGLMVQVSETRSAALSTCV